MPWRCASSPKARALLGAPRLIPIASAHIDGALYHGDSGTLFAETAGRGRRAGSRCRPTLNVGALDLMGCSRVRLASRARRMARRMMDAYRKLGCERAGPARPTRRGTGRRSAATSPGVKATPSCSAIRCWARAPTAMATSSTSAPRCRAARRITACILPTTAAPRSSSMPRRSIRRLVDEVAFWPVLGAWLGEIAGGRSSPSPAYRRTSTRIALKALGAAAASTGAVGLFHVAGVTPEAPAARAGHETILFERRDAACGARSAVDGARGHWRPHRRRGVGSPHFSLRGIPAAAAAAQAGAVSRPVYVCTGRHGSGAERRGAALESERRDHRRRHLHRGDADPAGDGGVLMTNSGKFAHYAPAQYRLRRALRLAGRLRRDGGRRSAGAR